MPREAHLNRVMEVLGSQVGLIADLAALPAGNLRAVLLGVAARRAASRRPADLLRHYEREASFLPSPIDAAEHRRLQRRAVEQLPRGFVELELAPHAPLGTSSVLGDFSQTVSRPRSPTARW